jgi:hypothetical protein
VMARSQTSGWLAISRSVRFMAAGYARFCSYSNC